MKKFILSSLIFFLLGTSSIFASYYFDKGAVTDTNAETICTGATYLDGEGNCVDVIEETELDTSAELSTQLTDETGSGLAVFGTSPTITTPNLTLEDGNAAAPTTDGRIKFDRTTERLQVGDGTGTNEFYSGVHTTDTTAADVCAGTQTYLDGEGNCDTLDGLEDFETATDDAVVVGNGTTFNSKVIPTCNTSTEKTFYNTSTNTWSCESDQTSGLGGPITLDLADDSSNESTDLLEIATTNDTNSIFTEPTADKLLIDVSLNWPTADDADDVTCSGCIADSELATDFISENELDTETELETQLTDVTDVFTNNDGALNDDDLSDNIIDDLLDVTHTTVAAANWLIRNTANTAWENQIMNGDATVSADGTIEVTQADALETNPTNCSIGLAPEGIDASGVVENCNDYILESELTSESDLETQIGSVNVIVSTEIDTSSELATLLTDETGTGAAVFGTGPTISLAANSTIPNGTAVTTDAAGEVTVDTTTDDLVYYGTAQRVLTFEKPKSFVLESPTDADRFVFWEAPYNITVQAIHCIVDPADSGETVVIGLYESDTNGDFTNLSTNGLDGTTTITCANTPTDDDGALSNSTIDSGDHVGIDIGTVTGTVSFLTVSFEYTKDRE